MFKHVENKQHQSSFVFEFIIDEDGNVNAPRIYNKTEKDLTEADIYEIYTSENRTRIITSVVGGCNRCWCWRSHRGIAGYFVGREVTETVYDLVTTSGFKIVDK